MQLSSEISLSDFRWYGRYTACPVPPAIPGALTHHRESTLLDSTAAEPITPHRTPAPAARGTRRRRRGRRAGNTDDRGSDREWATDLRARAPAEVSVQDDRETRARRYRSPRWKRGLRVHGASLRSIHPGADFPVGGPHRRTERPYPAVVEPRDVLICGSRSHSANKPVMTSRERSLGVLIRAIWSPRATPRPVEGQLHRASRPAASPISDRPIRLAPALLRLPPPNSSPLMSGRSVQALS